jgi:hypothetical protein
MKKKKDIPIKFICLNIIAAFGVLIITHLTEPAKGTIFFLIVLSAFVVVTILISIISRLIDRLPLPIRAIAEGAKEYCFYLFVAYIGWRSHELYQTVEEPGLSVKSLVGVIAVTAIVSIGTSYKKHLNNQREKIS